MVVRPCDAVGVLTDCNSTLIALVQRYPSTPSVEPLLLDHELHIRLALVTVNRALSRWIRICLLSGVTMTSTQPENITSSYS